MKTTMMALTMTSPRLYTTTSRTLVKHTKQAVLHLSSPLTVRNMHLMRMVICYGAGLVTQVTDALVMMATRPAAFITAVIPMMVPE